MDGDRTSRTAGAALKQERILQRRRHLDRALSCMDTCRHDYSSQQPELVVVTFSGEGDGLVCTSSESRTHLRATAMGFLLPVEKHGKCINYSNND